MRDAARLNDNAAGIVPPGRPLVGGLDVARYFDASAAAGATHFVTAPQPQIPVYVAVDTQAVVDSTMRAGLGLRFAIPVADDPMVT